MRRFLTLFILLVVVLVLFSGCSKKELSFTMETYPRVDGSTVTIPLSEALAARLTGQSVEAVRPYILHNKTHSAYVNLIENKTDLIFVTSPSKEELELAKEKGVTLEVIPIVSEAFVFLNHGDNPVGDLSAEAIRRIYTGEITNWSEVGGNDSEIVAYQRPVNSGSQTGFYELVMKDLVPMDPPQQLVMAGMGELIDAVAHYENAANALGYSYYYFVVDMWGNDAVKLLSVDGVYPDATTIASGAYPFKTAYYAVIRSDEPKESPVRQVIQWILSDEGQALMEDSGYVKVK
jgi:phosphate transport system substrate-binding protein